MSQDKLNDVCRGWGEKDLANLGSILGLPENEQTLSSIETRVKWLFYSKARAKTKVVAKTIWGKLGGAKGKFQYEDQFESPAYIELLSALLEELDINCKDATLLEKEAFLCDAVIAEALVNMSPEQRRRAFSEQVEFDEISENVDSRDNSFKQVAKGVGAFSLAKAAGFSLYTSSTMALGFASSMAGITLPFAVYTGMTSFISIILGPIGWVAGGTWAFWKFTSPDWDRLRVALLYIIAVNSKAIKSSAHL